MSDKQISETEIISIGGTWQKTVQFVPESGEVAVYGTVTHSLKKKGSDQDVSSSYVTGSPSHNNAQLVTTGQVGTGTPQPGHYTYFLRVPANGQIYILFQEFEFVVEKGK